MKKTTILGVDISAVSDYEEAYFIISSLISQSPSYITVNNVHTVIEAVLHPEYGRIINSSALAIPDGKPLSVYAKFRGVKNISRIFGPTLLEKTLAWGQVKKIKHFFFGSSGETLTKMLQVIKIKYPEAIVAGAIIPPFRKFTDEEESSFINEINSSGADLVWVGLGAPKQEIWISKNYAKLERGVMLGIGAGFDYLAGNLKHAPKWMKEMSLEWFYRLIQEPRRLWKRYLVYNTLFLWYVFLEFIGLKKFE